MATKRRKRCSPKGGIKRLADEPEFRKIAENCKPGKSDPARLAEYIETGAEFPPVLTVTQAAALLQVSRQHIYTLLKQKHIKGVRVGKRLRFSRDAILDRLKGK